MDLCNCDWRSTALAEAYVESRRRGLRFLGRILRDPQGAEDVLHDSWLRALERRAPLEKGPAAKPDGVPERAPRFWVETFRLAHRERRRARREAPIEIGGMETVLVASERTCFWVAGDRWHSPELLECVRSEIARLPELDRRLLVRAYEDRRTTCQISRETGLTRAALWSRLKRGRARVRRAVERRLLERLRSAPQPPSGDIGAAADGTHRTGAESPGGPGDRARKE
jgi:DNA-directed RNA polymerase specialized sigma24 family protein